MITCTSNLHGKNISHKSLLVSSRLLNHSKLKTDMDELKKAQESNSTIFIHFVLNNPLIYSFGIMYEKQLNITSVNHSVLDSN